MTDEELMRKMQELIEPALVALVAIHIQEAKSFESMTFEDAVMFAEEKIARTRKILGFPPASV